MRWIYRFGSNLPFFLAVLAPVVALARVGGGENYTSSSGSSGSSGGGGGDGGELAALLIWLVLEHPIIGIPVLIVVAVGFVLSKRNTAGAKTQRAFQQREAELRTQVSPQDVLGWTNALKLKDPSFDLLQLQEKMKTLFVEVQHAWFKRDLQPVRPFVSDAVFQRLTVQLKLMAAQGVRDAITDIQVQDVQLIGLDQSEWYDTVHLRVRASIRDTEVPTGFTDQQAVEAAKKVVPERFTEVWSFVRKPGAKTKIGEDLYQGKCPNCGAPFKGGATNSCEFCGAVVNSGNYDWTLSTITQGVEFVRQHATVDGLLQARQSDPALNLEILHDRASLLFWKWVDAHGSGEAARLAKVASPQFQALSENELGSLRQLKRRKVFLECAVGGVRTRILHAAINGYDEACVEIRWSARMGIGPADQKPPNLPIVPQRWVFTLSRKTGAATNVANGMSTNRCLNCNAPLTDSATVQCDYCGANLAGGDKDWVISAAAPFEAWNVAEQHKYRLQSQARAVASPKDMVVDPAERQRLIFMMAAMAASDGVVDDRERRLLKMCAQRWSVPWTSVEQALAAGPTLFDRLLQKGSEEAESFLRTLVQMALIDGKVDRKERQLLEAAALHLGVPEKLPKLLHG